MRVFHCDRFEIPLPPGHRFPQAKYRLLRERVERERLVAPHELIEAEPASRDELLLAHDAAWVDRAFAGLSPPQERLLGFPWSPQLVERSRRSVGATIAAARAALEDGRGASLAGGTHHAFADRGEGFCMFNDVAVALRMLRRERAVDRALVVDCDVHQGNGTAAILADDPWAFTLSLHGARNYPARKERSDLDVELDDGTGDDAYLAALAPALDAAFERARPQLVIYLAGADPFEDDALGRLALTKRGLARRDETVLGRSRREGAAVAVVMGGGYARDVEDGVDIHFQTLRILRDAP